MIVSITATLDHTGTSATPKKVQRKPLIEVDHRVEQGDRPPRLAERADRVEGAAEEGQRRHDQHRDDLQLLEILAPRCR